MKLSMYSSHTICPFLYKQSEFKTIALPSLIPVNVIGISGSMRKITDGITISLFKNCFKPERKIIRLDKNKIRNTLMYFMTKIEF